MNMKKALKYAAVTAAVCVSSSLSNAQQFRHIVSAAESEARKGLVDEVSVQRHERNAPECTADTIIHFTTDSITAAYYNGRNIMPLKPRVFCGYRNLRSQNHGIPDASYSRIAGVVEQRDSTHIILRPAAVPYGFGSSLPEWLRTAMRAERITRDLEYSFMIANPLMIETSYWDLPVPPVLPEEDNSFAGYLRRLNLPSIDTGKAVLPEFSMEKRHWLHYLNAGIQFSQAYVSSNWYQGGNNYLALLFNLTWNVDLNTVFHPDLLFQSALQYKLGVNSNPRESLHPYSISQDLFQYNLKTGFKAFQRWFYSFNLQFNTQLFNAYPDDSEQRSASILSPATLNMGIGMTYNYQNKPKTFKLSLSISPVAYNVKTCIDTRIDPTQFNIKAGHKTLSEIGSNLEANFEWAIRDNIRWKSRLFLFSNYKYFLADYESTIEFAFNRFLSTQFYLHPRFDSSSDFNSSRWHHWMLKEILSFGLSYTFSSKE